MMSAPHDKISVLFRGKKVELRLDREESVRTVKIALAATYHDDNLQPDDVRLLWKANKLHDDVLMMDIFPAPTGKPQTFHLVATGVSKAEATQLQEERDAKQRENARVVRDDLSKTGQERLRQKSLQGRRLMQQQRRKEHSPSHDYGFGTIETLPCLPNEAEARKILEKLAKDPGVLACMAKHQWKVGTLAELYPEGNVGESPVCVMGLNQNKGATILLRLRTDNLEGFRKILSVRKVLFHELAHNVHSEHDDKFFQLMRQIERECNEMDWTQGGGLTDEEQQLYKAGSYKLGGTAPSNKDRRELAALAAERRMTAEEQEIEDNCGCGRNKFMP